jgi:hypothetical protein
MNLSWRYMSFQGVCERAGMNIPACHADQHTEIDFRCARTVAQRLRLA